MPRVGITSVALVLSLLLIGAGCSSSTVQSSRVDYADSDFGSRSVYGSSTDEEKTIDRDDAISDYWDDIKEYLSGSAEIEACSSESGNCYDLDAEISSGRIEELEFSNGGYLNFSADIDESGNASDSDNDGGNWDFTLDMDSSIVDDAIEDWADDNEYTIE